MTDNRDWFVKSVDGKVYGPAKISKLVEWAKDGRIEPTGFVSTDRVDWLEACSIDELEMKWLVEVSPGDVFGPFHRELVISLFKNGTVPATARAYRLHEFPIDQDPPPVEKIVEKEVPVEVEKIVEKEVRVEVPVEVPSLGRGQAIRRGEGPGDDPPPRRGLHPRAPRARGSAERRTADSDARASRVQGAARLRLLLPRLPRQVVEGAARGPDPRRATAGDRRLSHGMD